MIIERGQNGQIIKSTGSSKGRFCLRGHDKNIVGRDRRQCAACRKFYGILPDKNHARNRQWKHKGIRNEVGENFTVVDFDRLYQIQKGQCAICCRHQSILKRPLNVDHNHRTGRARGLLCTTCNTDLGRKENIMWNQKADLYLKTKNTQGDHLS